MADPPDPYLELDAALTAKFLGYAARDRSEWNALAAEDAGKVPLHAARAWLTRVRSSHRGIGARKALKHLVAVGANQDYLDEICSIERLEQLELEYPVTATSLDGLRALTRLRYLRIDSPRNITDFTPLLDLASLRTLLIANARHMTDIGWLAGAHHLEVIGIEGSMWADQKIPTLAPIGGLRGLRAFFATSARLGDKDLSPLAECPRLEYLHCTRLVRQEEFERLHRLKPDLVCYWFQPAVWDAIERWNRSTRG